MYIVSNFLATNSKFRHIKLIQQVHEYFRFKVTILQHMTIQHLKRTVWSEVQRNGDKSSVKSVLHQIQMHANNIESALS